MAFSLDDLKKYSDVVLVSSDGDEHSCHKVYLSNSSLFFRELFSSTTDSRVVIESMSSAELRDLLKCVYSPFECDSQIHINNVKMLIEAARKYQMSGLLRACDNFCTQKVNLYDEVIFDWMAFAFEYELPAFSTRCKEYVMTEDTAALIGDFLLRPENSQLDKVAVCLLETAQEKL